MDKFKLNSEFRKYVTKYVSLQFLGSFILFVTLLFTYDLKFAGLIMYVFMFMSLFIMVIDIRGQYKYFQLDLEIKNLKYIIKNLGGKK